MRAHAARVARTSAHPLVDLVYFRVNYVRLFAGRRSSRAIMAPLTRSTQTGGRLEYKAAPNSGTVIARMSGVPMFHRVRRVRDVGDCGVHYRESKKFGITLGM